MNIQKLKLNEVIIKKSHNSYERNESIVEQLSKFDDPRDCNCRGLELDINFTDCTNPEKSNFFEVYHKSRSTDVRNLADYLSDIKRWHKENSGHNFVFIAIDLKNNTTNRAKKEGISDSCRYPEQIDKYLEKFFGEDLIFKPKDLLCCSTYSSLYDYICNNSWPTLEEIGDRFIFCLTGEWKNEYASKNPSLRFCFADYFVSGEADKIPQFPIDKNVLFYNCRIHHTADRDKWTKILPHYQKHRLITRAYTIDKESLWKDALRSGVNILDTTKVSNYDWAKLPNGAAYIKQHYTLWNKMNGTKYDTGNNPSAVISKDGTIIEIHNGGGNNNLYYNIGRLNSNIGIDWLHLGVKYDTGKNPTVAIADDGTIIEIHTGSESNNLYYNIGRLNGNLEIDWLHLGVKYDTGKNPTVAITDDGTIIEIHTGSESNNLYYNIGRLNSNLGIDWLHIGVKYDTGNKPTVAIADDETIIEIHTGSKNNNLYYNIGSLQSDYQIKWIYTGVQYDTGNNPSIAIAKNGNIVEIHNGEENNNLYYNIGSLDKDHKIEWKCIGMKYDTGTQPTVTISEDGTLIDIHNGGGNNNLYYNIGNLYGY